MRTKILWYLIPDRNKSYARSNNTRFSPYGYARSAHVLVPFRWLLSRAGYPRLISNGETYSTTLLTMGTRHIYYYIDTIAYDARYSPYRYARSAHFLVPFRWLSSRVGYPRLISEPVIIQCAVSTEPDLLNHIRSFNDIFGRRSIRLYYVKLAYCYHKGSHGSSSSQISAI